MFSALLLISWPNSIWEEKEITTQPKFATILNAARLIFRGGKPQTAVVSSVHVDQSSER